MEKGGDSVLSTAARFAGKQIPMTLLISHTHLEVANKSAAWNPRYLHIIAIFFVSSLLIANVLATKFIAIGPFIVNAGILIFPISYIVGDVMTEVYGFKRARRLIYWGLGANLAMALLLQAAVLLPPAPAWPLQESFAAIHTMAPRIVMASIIAYFFGELVNALIMSRLKIITMGKHLWARTVSSTLVGQFVDSALFVFIAFAGVLPGTMLVATILSGWALKSLYEIVMTPVTYIVISWFKAREGVDHFDREEKFDLF
jgi:queuosine precursor transporter